jgi:hypothetical protein
MKPNLAERTITGNVTGEDVRMGFAKGAENHLMGLLANMYSDLELAVIREYSTNARDSHIEAGCPDRPIEVMTGTPLQPYLLSIKDYGVGLSKDDIVKVYSQYGASTKRDSNDVNGMLGIGSKAGLTYAAQFTVVAVKDHKRTVINVSRAQDGSNAMTIVQHTDTTEPNGVEVQIPLKSGNQIAAKANKFFAFWPEGSVLINGAAPKRDFSDALKLTDDLMIVKSNSRYGALESTVVMGYVPYPAGDKLGHYSLGIPHGYAVIARVPIGAVDFAPSREALMFTSITDRTLDAVAKEVRTEMVKAVQRKIEEAPTRPAAVKAVNEWKALLGRNKPAAFHHKGTVLPTTITRPVAEKMLLTSAASYRLAAASNQHVIDIEYVTQALFITGYNMSSHTATHKKKTLQWIEKNRPSMAITNIVLCSWNLDTTWIEKDRVVDWATVNAEKLPSRTSGSTSTRLPGSYDIVERKSKGLRTTSRTEVKGSDLDTNKPFFYIHGNLSAGYRFTPILDQLYDDGYTVVCLPANRIDKFKRDNPTVLLADDAVKQAHGKWLNTLTLDQRKALAAHHKGHMRSYGVLAGLKGLLDPALVEAANLSKIDLSQILKAERVYMNQGIDTKYDAWTNPLDNYLLWDMHKAHYFSKAMVEYLNLVYEKHNS